MDDMLWITEGYMQDDAGNLVMTSYVDVREPGSRTPIRALVKGCRREHALEDSETVLVSPLKRFREEGANLIRDDREGLAKEETETVHPETPEQALARRQVEDLSDAIELLDSGITVKRTITNRNVERSSESLTFGKEWWIYSTAVTPETEDEWTAWRATLDPKYDHVSEIGQPAKFAEALARMVSEQLGPQSEDGTTTSTIGGTQGLESRHRSQWVLHGPVVYTDSVYEALSQEGEDEMAAARHLAASMFTKSASHAAQREYRFVILRDGMVDDKVFLRISGMMRDALRLTEHGLVRRWPEAPAAARPELGAPKTAARTVSHQRATTTERVGERTEGRWEAKGRDGRVLSSESERREHVRERTVAHEFEPADRTAEAPAVTGAKDTGGDAAPTPAPDDVAAVKTLATEAIEPADGRGTEGGELVIHGVTGRAYGSFEEMFEDPAFPTGRTKQPWAEAALDADEVHGIYGMVATLAHKVTRVSSANRQDAASACWHAIQCIHNIVVRFGDIVATVAIERERFVVLQLKESEELQAKGRIVLAPSGAYAFCLQRRGVGPVGYSQGDVGLIFFPIGSQIEMFDGLGWRAKEEGDA